MKPDTRIKLQELALDLAAEAKGLDLLLSGDPTHDQVCDYMLRIKKADHDLQWAWLEYLAL